MVNTVLALKWLVDLNNISGPLSVSTEKTKRKNFIFHGDYQNLNIWVCLHSLKVLLYFQKSLWKRNEEKHITSAEVASDADYH